MAAYGFVYLLSNEFMPGVYKIGYSDRAPHQRIEELSKSTGVPAPFDAICYIEVEDAQRVERQLHAQFRGIRISQHREFFHAAFPPELVELLSAFEFHPEQLAIAKSSRFGELLERMQYGEKLELWDVYDPQLIADKKSKLISFEDSEASRPSSSRGFD